MGYQYKRGLTPFLAYKYRIDTFVELCYPGLMKPLSLRDLPYSPGYLLLAKERIEDSYVVTGDGCWEWIKARSSFGYGKVGLKQNGAYHTFPAHRVYYQLVNGFIDGDLVVDHLCKNPPCINPKHLEAITHRENNSRGSGITANNIRKTRCDNGHEFTEENTGRYTKTGWRYCRICCRTRTNRRASQKTRDYHAKGLNSKGVPLPDNWKKKYGLL
jgi:hypothetical protein